MNPNVGKADGACCKGFAVEYYSFTLYALDLEHPRLLQR